MKRIAVIGSLNVDYVAYVTQQPQVGETVLSNHFEMVPGGKGANQAFAIGRMGANVSMFGAIGVDANSTVELSNLESAGVDVSHIRKTSDPTGVALITVNQSGNNSIVVVQGANLAVTREYIDTNLDALCECDIIIFQLEIPLDTVIYAAEILKKRGKTIILDPAPVSDPLPAELLKHVDFLKPNETELATLSGISGISLHLESACQMLLDQGVGCVLASLGKAGVMLATAQSKRIFPVRDVNVVDTTAAGDSFTAAFSYALCMGCPVEKAIQFANEVATIVVQRKGAQTSIPTTQEIEQLWASQKMS